MLYINGRIKLLRKIFIAFLIIFSAGILTVLLCNSAIKSQVRARILTANDAAALRTDCILILGAGVREDNSPSHMLEDRLKTGIDLYKAGTAPKLLMSGDHGRIGYNEVGVMKLYAVRQGIPDCDVFMDHAGFSTYESLYRIRDVFNAKKIIIVTQEYHLYRALYIAEKMGLDAYGVSANLRTYMGQPVREVREIAARFKDALWCIIKPAPTYLGEVIPINGDGNATNDDAYEFFQQTIFNTDTE